MDLKTATPVEIDTKLAEIDAEIRNAEARNAAAWDRVVRAATKFVGKDGKWEKVGRKTVPQRATDEEIAAATVEAAEFEGEDINAMAWEQRVQARNGLALVEAQIAFEESTERVYEIRKTTRPYEAEYTARGGWPRFFLVTSSNGHIHSSQSCATCGPRTTYGWLPGASGQTMAEAIAERDKTKSAALLCTICFPDAPVAWTEAPINDALCPGSKTMDYNRETARTRYVSGNYGECNHCHTRVTLTSALNMRKHNKA